MAAFVCQQAEIGQTDKRADTPTLPMRWAPLKTAGRGTGSRRRSAGF